MSFKYKGVLCTLNNYSEMFNKLSPDFIDEIRLAILDDTPIGAYLSDAIAMRDGANKLAQVRKALRDYVPARYISLRVSAEVTEAIRTLYNKRGESGLSQLEPYFPLNGVIELPDATIKYIVMALISGADIHQVDFKKVATDNVDIIVSGLIKGYPMWLVADGCYNKDYLRVLMSAMRVGLDAHPFCEDNWDCDSIKYLVENANTVKKFNLLSFVNPKFDKGRLTEIVYACNNKLNFEKLCIKDREGNPLFNEYQMGALNNAMTKGIPLDTIYDWNMSDLEMETVISGFENG